MECFVLGKFMTNREKLQYTVTLLTDLVSLIVSIFITLFIFDWTFAFLAFLRKPILGYGWSWFPNNNTISPGDYGHNVYYEILCETGAVGTAIISLLFIVTLIRGMRVLHILSVRKRKYPEFYRRVVCCAVAYEIFFLLYCSTGNPLYEYSCYLPYFLFIGMVEVINRKIKGLSENE